MRVTLVIAQAASICPAGLHHVCCIRIAGTRFIKETGCADSVFSPILSHLDFRLHMHCIFNASDFLPLQASIFPPPSPAAVTQSGPLRLELRIAKGTLSLCFLFLPLLPRCTAHPGSRAPLPVDVTYGSYYGEGDYPIVRLLREPVPVEVRLLQRTDPSLVLVLHQCWATPSANPVQQPQWPILWDG